MIDIKCFGVHKGIKFTATIATIDCISNFVGFHNSLSLPGTAPGRRVISLTRYKGKDNFIFPKDFHIFLQKSCIRSTTADRQRTVPDAKARSKATSVSLCLPNSNQCLYLDRLTNTRHTPDGSRAIYALTFVSIPLYPWFAQYPIRVTRLHTFNVFQRFRRVKVTATVFPAGLRVHPI